MSCSGNHCTASLVQSAEKESCRMIHYQENQLTPDILNTVRTAVGWTSYPVPQLERAIRHTVYSVTAWEEDQPVGIARLTGDGIYYLLCDVAVIPAAQSRGIGRRMVQRLIAMAQQDLANEERASIALVSANGKEPFYASMGFSAIPNAKAGHGMQLFLTAES